jgi:uncharacterized iron-regulated protein
MRQLLALAAVGLLGSCAAVPRVALLDEQGVLRSGEPVPFARLADALAKADVVVLGEEHESERTHLAHQELLRELHARRPDLVISMEMFERDAQAALTQYLRHDIDEDDFLAHAHPWPNYKTDYRPVVEYARAHKLEVIAANVPRDLASKVSKQGIDAVKGAPYGPHATAAPEDEYWDAFQNAMREDSHGGGLDEAAMRRFYQAQCLKDDTMAESIAERLQALRQEGRKPLVVHFCGKFHSDSRLGTVARLQQRLPDLSIRVLSVVGVKPTLADYVFVVPDEEQVPKRKADPHKLGPAHPAADKPPAEPPAEPPADPASPPGLGLMPDYGFQGDGMRVEEVREDGAAAKAGIQAGDVIVKLAGEAVDGVQGYADLLQKLHPGQKVEVALRRDGRDVKLDVVVGTRSR